MNNIRAGDKKRIQNAIIYEYTPTQNSTIKQTFFFLLMQPFGTSLQDCSLTKIIVDIEIIQKLFIRYCAFAHYQKYLFHIYLFSKIWKKVQKIKKVPNFAIFKVELIGMSFKRMFVLNY